MSADLLGISLAAVQVGVSKPTLYRAAKAGSITLFKRPGMTFVSMAELQPGLRGQIPASHQRGPNWGPVSQ